MIKKSRVEERIMPGFLPWYMELERNTETGITTVAVRGNRGGLKSRFYVVYLELKEAVSQLSEHATVFILTSEDVLEIASQMNIPAEAITDDVLHRVKKGVEFGLECWSEVVRTALEEALVKK